MAIHWSRSALDLALALHEERPRAAAHRWSARVATLVRACAAAEAVALARLDRTAGVIATALAPEGTDLSRERAWRDALATAADGGSPCLTPVPGRPGWVTATVPLRSGPVVGLLALRFGPEPAGAPGLVEFLGWVGRIVGEELRIGPTHPADLLAGDGEPADAPRRSGRDPQPVPAVRKNPARADTHVNRAFLEQSGLGAGQILGQTDAALFPGMADAGAADPAAWERPLSEERLHRRPGGEAPRDLIVRTVPLRDADGATEAVLGVWSDVTDRKQFEADLRASRELYRSIVHDLTELVARYQPDGTVTFVNDAFCQFFGRSAVELIGHPWEPAVHPDDFARVSSELMRIGPDYPVAQFASRVFDAQGRLRWLEFINRAVLGPGGTLEEIQAVGRDITERKRFEAQLSDVAQRLKLATDAAGIGTFTWTFRTNTLECDERLVAWYGLPGAAGEAGVPYDSWGALVHPEDRAETDRRLRLARDGGPPFDHEFRVLCADGRAVRVHSTALIERDEEGRRVRMIGIHRDVTAERALEDRLRAAQQAAEASTLAKSAFLANMSHEVRTPVGAILGFAEMLLDPELPADEGPRAIRAIRRNGSHLLAILNDVLDLSKIEAGKLELERIPYSPWTVVEEMESLLRGRAHEGKVTLITRPVGLLPDRVLTDPTRLRQILVNLVSNAVKFTAPGGLVEVRLLAEPPSDPARGSSEGGHLEFAVQDQGIGMSADEVRRLFRPFEQADSSTTRKFGGTGLGLSITGRLVDAMGGTIDVQSEPGQGSQFRVRLPLRLPECGPVRWRSPVEPPGQEAEVSSALAREARRFDGRILLAEDNADNRRVLLYHLRRLGLVEVVTVVDGRAAIERALGDRFDLILMDLQMPEVDGYDATRSLRAAGYRGWIVALTAHSLREAHDQSLAAGCDAHLTKPIHLPTLVDTLARFLPAAGSPRP